MGYLATPQIVDQTISRIVGQVNRVSSGANIKGTEFVILRAKYLEEGGFLEVEPPGHPVIAARVQIPSCSPGAPPHA